MIEGPVRLATPADEDEIFGLLVLMHAEGAPFAFDRDKVRNGIRKGTRREGGIVGVIEGPKRIEASIGLVIGEGAWYTRDNALGDMWNFVHPDHRRTNHANALLDFGKACADWFTAGGTVLPLQMAVVSNERTAAKCRMYQRKLTKVGEYYVYTPPDVKSAVA